MKQAEIADLLEKGLSAKNTTEALQCFLEDIHERYYVCALGAILVGKYGDAKTAFEAVENEKYGRFNETIPADYLDIAIRLLEIDANLAQAIDRSHMLGIPADVIIQRMRQGTFSY